MYKSLILYPFIYINIQKRYTKLVENKLEQEIIQLYDNNLVDLFSINQISQKLNKKYPYINKKVSELIERGILKKMVIGRSYLCSLNLDNEKTILLLSLNEINKKESLDISEIESFVSSTHLESSILSVLKAGDRFYFIVQDLRDRHLIGRKFPDSVVISKNEFLDMILEDRQIFTDHVVIYGYGCFFNLLRCAYPEIRREFSPLRY